MIKKIIPLFSKIKNQITKASDPGINNIKSDFVRSPKEDCFANKLVDIQQFKQNREALLEEFKRPEAEDKLPTDEINKIFKSTKDANQLKVKKELYKYLKTLKNNEGKDRIEPYEYKILLNSVDSSQEAEYVKEIINIKDNEGNNIMEAIGTHEILTSIKQNPNLAELKINLVKEFANVKNEEGHGLLFYEISKIAAYTKSLEEAKVKLNFAKKIINFKNINNHYMVGNVNLGYVISPVKTEIQAKKEEINLLKKIRTGDYEGLTIMDLNF